MGDEIWTNCVLFFCILVQKICESPFIVINVLAMRTLITSTEVVLATSDKKWSISCVNGIHTMCVFVILFSADVYVMKKYTVQKF
jgi:hypothetical protein